MNSTPFAVALKLWARTVLLNAVFLGLGVMQNGFVNGMDAIFAALFFGFIFSAPLLVIIIPLVKISIKLPYGIAARIGWLGFYLEVLIIGFYTLFRIPIEILFSSFGISLYLLFIATATIGLTGAIIWTRLLLRKLNTITYEYNLV